MWTKVVLLAALVSHGALARFYSVDYVEKVRDHGFIRPGPFHARLQEITGVDFESLDEPTTTTTPERVNAQDFGMTPEVETSQTSALHEAMRYFYNRGVEGTVYIPAGTYSVATGVRFHQGVNLVGDGIGKTVLKKGGTDASYVVRNPVIRSGYVLNVTVSNLTFDGDLENRATQGLSRIGGMNLDTNVSNLTLDSIEVRDVTTALILRRLKDSVIRNCIIDRKNGHGITFGSADHEVGDVRNNLITGNLFTNSTGGSGINLSRATYTTVTNNQIINEHVQDGGYGGIRIPNGGAYNIVENNVIEYYPRGLFVLSGSHDNILSGNTVKNSGSHGVLIQADNNTLTDNIIQQTDALDVDSGIRLGDSNHNQILRNTVEIFPTFNKPGIRLTGSHENTIQDNIITTSGIAVSIEGGSGNLDIDNIHVTN